MRKHFLLLFLMAILPLAGWAIEDKPQFTLSDPDGIITSETTVANAPTVTHVKKGETALDITKQGGIFDRDLKEVSNWNGNGYYFRKVYYTDGEAQKAAYVPFYVANRIPTLKRVNDPGSFVESLAEGEAYNLYYQAYPYCDVWYKWGGNETQGVYLHNGYYPTTESPYWTGSYVEIDADGANAKQWYQGLFTYEDGFYADRIIRSWEATKTTNPDDYTLSFYDAGPAKWKVGVKYGEYQTWYPWGDTETIENSTDFGGTSKNWGLLSVKDIKDHFELDAFVDNQLTISFVPVRAKVDAAGIPDTLEVDVKSLANAEVTLTNAPYEYNGKEQKPIFTATTTSEVDAYVTIPGAGQQDDVTLEEGKDYYISWTSTGYVSPGTKSFNVIGKGAYEGSVNKSYEITGKEVTINPAYTFKTYGDADPVSPKYAFDATSLIPGEDKDLAITRFLKLVRNEEGEDVGAYLYHIELTDNYKSECNYKITILQNNSNLVIEKAPLEINVTEYWKKYNADDPDFTWTVVDENQLTNGDTKDDVKPTITRADKGEAVNATLTGNVASPLVEGDGYAFEGTSKNYLITFANKFLIVPTDDASGINITVKNNAESEVNTLYNKTSNYTYTGKAITPGMADTDYDKDLVVEDANGPLALNTDYTIKEYKFNTHAGAENAAKVTITLKGSYTTQDLTGSFTINKAKLQVKAADQELHPGDAEGALTLEFPGSADAHNFWVNDEGTNEGPATGEHAPQGYEAPTITKTLESNNSYKLTPSGGNADDYEFDYVPGYITYGKTILTITATSTGKTYGEEDPKLEYTVKHGTADASAEEWEALGGKEQPYFTISRAKGENVGQYAITFKGPKVYNEGVQVSYIPGTFTISRKTVTLKGENATKVYGENNPTFKATVWDGETQWTPEQEAAAGITNPDFYYVGVQDATWNRQQQRWILASEDVTPGDSYYAVQPHLQGTDIAGNYIVTIGSAGKFTITKAPLTLTPDENTKGFGQADPQLTATAVGLKFQDQITAADTTIVRPNRLTNYEVTCVPGTGKFHITAQELFVVANDQAIKYGQAINPYDVTILINNVDQEWSEDQIKEVLYLTTDVTSVGANENAYELHKANNANYTVPDDNFTNGWLTIAALKDIPLDTTALKAIVPEIPLKQVLEDHKGRKVNVYLPARTMVADEWYTWVLPFKVKPSQLFRDAIWGYGALETLNEDKSHDDVIVFGLNVASEIPANTPFIVKIETPISDASVMKQKVFEGVTIDDEADYLNGNHGAVSTDGKVKFIGLYETKKGFDDTEMYNGKDNKDGHRKFFTGGSNSGSVKVNPTHAYLKLAGNATQARVLIEEPDGTLTAISNVNTDAQNANAEGIYNLNGVKLNAAPTQKGVYIQNGKKVVIK